MSEGWSTEVVASAVTVLTSFYHPQWTKKPSFPCVSLCMQGVPSSCSPLDWRLFTHVTPSRHDRLLHRTRPCDYHRCDRHRCGASGGRRHYALIASFCFCLNASFCLGRVRPHDLKSMTRQVAQPPLFSSPHQVSDTNRLRLRSLTV